MIGYLCMLTAAFLWGLIGPVSRLAFAHGLTPLEVAFWRATFGGLLFGLHVFLLRKLRVAWRDLPILLGFGLVGVALFYASFQFAVHAGGGAMAAVLLYTAPAWVALLSWVFLREPMGPHKLVALLLTLLGVAGVANCCRFYDHLFDEAFRLDSKAGDPRSHRLLEVLRCG